MTTGKLQVLAPLAFTPGSTGGGDTGAANLVTPDPKEIYQAGDAGGRYLKLDFGTAVTLDAVFLGFTNAAGATRCDFSTTDSGGSILTTPLPASAATQIRAADCVTPRSSFFGRFAPASSRYWALGLDSNATAMQIGILMAGVSFECDYDREWGSGRRLIDTTKTTQLLSGGFGVQEGARKAAYGWTFGDMTDAEVVRLWGVVMNRGIGKPVVVHEREGVTIGANEALHYGLMTRIDTFERREPNCTKWAFEIEEWI